MFCSNCGKQLEEGAAFCANCGTPISKMRMAESPSFIDKEMAQKNVGMRDAVVESLKIQAKLIFLVVFAAAFIAAGIGLIAYVTEHHDDPKPFNSAKIKAQTIWEADGLKVDAKKLVNQKFERDALLLKVKNSTGQDLTIKSASFAINGGSVQSHLDSTVLNGKTEEVKLEMEGQEYYLGVETPGVLTLELLAENPSSGEVVLHSDILTVKTTEAENANEASITGYFDKYNKLFDKDGINVGSFGYLIDPIGPGFGIDNKTDKAVRADFVVTSISGRELRPTNRFYQKSSVIQAGSIGCCFVHSNFEELKQMDSDGKGDVFPVKTFSGVCSLYDAVDNSLIAEVPFTYNEK